MKASDIKANNILIFCVFPRSILYEGIRAVALSTYGYFEHNTNLKPILVVPSKEDAPSEYRSIHVLDSSTPMSFAIVLYRMIFVALSARRIRCSYYVIENSISTPIVSIFISLFCKRDQFFVRFLTPLQNFSQTVKLLCDKFSIQIFIHYLFCNRMLADIFHFLQAKEGIYLVGSEYQKQQTSSYKLKVKIKIHLQIPITKSSSHYQKFAVAKKDHL